MTPPLPALEFEGIDNFRDFGGQAVSGGGRVAGGRLFRSAHHGRASDADLERLAALDLSVVVDLRRPEERAREPSKSHPAFAPRRLDNDIGQHEADSYVAFLKACDLSPGAMRSFLLDYYKAAPFEARHVDLYTRYFEALESLSGAVLIHCAAGKDRTGILAALTHHLLGVHFDDSVADYLLTNDEERIARRIDLFGAYVEELTGRKAEPQALRVSLGVEAAYLDAAFEAIRGRYGSIDAYLEEGLGVTQRRRAVLVERLTV
jgi:protein tyrosine/serine phosphatase